MNQVILQGNLARDPELQYSGKSGKAYCRFTVAISNKTTETETTDYVSCVCFGIVAEYLAASAQKGSPVVVSARLKTDMREVDGKKVYSLTCLAERVYACIRPQKQASQPAPQQPTENNQPASDGVPF